MSIFECRLTNVDFRIWNSESAIKNLQLLIVNKKYKLIEYEILTIDNFSIFRN